MMQKRHRKTLDAIFQKPDRKNIRWRDFVALLEALGADLTFKGGSLLGVKLHKRYAVFHKPHPRNEIYRSDLKRIRRFLIEARIDTKKD